MDPSGYCHRKFYERIIARQALPVNPSLENFTLNAPDARRREHHAANHSHDFPIRDRPDGAAALIETAVKALNERETQEL